MTYLKNTKIYFTIKCVHECMRVNWQPRISPYMWIIARIILHVCHTRTKACSNKRNALHIQVLITGRMYASDRNTKCECVWSSEEKFALNQFSVYTWPFTTGTNGMVLSDNVITELWRHKSVSTGFIGIARIFVMASAIYLTKNCGQKHIECFIYIDIYIYCANHVPC